MPSSFSSNIADGVSSLTASYTDYIDNGMDRGSIWDDHPVQGSDEARPVAVGQDEHEELSSSLYEEPVHEDLNEPNRTHQLAQELGLIATSVQAAQIATPQANNAQGNVFPEAPRGNPNGVAPNSILGHVQHPEDPYNNLELLEAMFGGPRDNEFGSSYRELQAQNEPFGEEQDEPQSGDGQDIFDTGDSELQEERLQWQHHVAQYNTAAGAEAKVEAKAENVGEAVNEGCGQEPVKEGSNIDFEQDGSQKATLDSSEGSFRSTGEQRSSSEGQRRVSRSIPSQPNGLYTSTYQPIAASAQDTTDLRSPVLDSQPAPAFATQVAHGHNQGQHPPQHIPNAIRGLLNNTPSGPASYHSQTQFLGPNLQPILGMTEDQQIPATNNFDDSQVPSEQKKPRKKSCKRGPVQPRPPPVWAEFHNITPQMRANPRGYEDAHWRIVRARNVPKLKTLKNTDLITSSERSGPTPGDWKPVVIAAYINTWIRQRYNLVLFRGAEEYENQVAWYDRRPLAEQAEIRIWITQQVEASLPAAERLIIANLRRNMQPAFQLSALNTSVADGTWVNPYLNAGVQATTAMGGGHTGGATSRSTSPATVLLGGSSGMTGINNAGVRPPSSHGSRTEGKNKRPRDQDQDDDDSSDSQDSQASPRHSKKPRISAGIVRGGVHRPHPTGLAAPSTGGSRKQDNKRPREDDCNDGSSESQGNPREPRQKKIKSRQSVGGNAEVGFQGRSTVGLPSGRQEGAGAVQSRQPTPRSSYSHGPSTGSRPGQAVQNQGRRGQAGSGPQSRGSQSAIRSSGAVQQQHPGDLTDRAYTPQSTMNNSFQSRQQTGFAAFESLDRFIADSREEPSTSYPDPTLFEYGQARQSYQSRHESQAERNTSTQMTGNTEYSRSNNTRQLIDVDDEDDRQERVRLLRDEARFAANRARGGMAPRESANGFGGSWPSQNDRSSSMQRNKRKSS